MAEAVKVKPKSKPKVKGQHSAQKNLVKMKVQDSNVHTQLIEYKETVPVLESDVTAENGKNEQWNNEYSDISIKTKMPNSVDELNDPSCQIEVIDSVINSKKKNENLEKQQNCDINDNAISSARLQTPSAPSAPLASSDVSCYSGLRKLLETHPLQSESTNLYPSLPCTALERIIGMPVPPVSMEKSHPPHMVKMYPNLHSEKNQMECTESHTVTHGEIFTKSNEVRPLQLEQLKNLYNNLELRDNDKFISSFVENELSIESHELYELILKYQKAREDCALSEERINELQTKYSGMKDNIWELTPDIKTEKSCCLDKKTVKADHPFIRISYNQSSHDEIKDILQKTYEEIEEHYCLHLHNRETTKRLIEHYLYSVSSAPIFKDIAETAPVMGYVKRECCQADHYDIHHLKICISVLFCFQRRLTKDEEFLKETRNWLTSLVALLLRVATFQDHLFILNHILRCPAHVGSWASSYIQSPNLPSWISEKDNPSLQSSLLDHTITVLATLLQPVSSREGFLQHCKSSVTLATGFDTPQDSHWVFVDSDNEEDLEPFDIWLRWEESDIVSFFTQIPFGDMFRFLLEIEESDGVEKYLPEKFESKSSEMLKLFSIATHLIYIFHKGFITFQSGKYRQLTKYITRYISDSVKYICKHWECVKKINKFDLPFLRRLEVEFDEFIFRAVSCISSAPRKEAWQFLLLPYKCVSNDMMWKLAWTLFNFDENQQRTLPVNEVIMNLQDEKMKSHFQEKIDRLEFMEAFYLLSALVEMVNSRESDEHLFVCTVTKIIFEVAFTALSVRERLSKDGRDMLKSIVERHPYVVTNILRELKIKIKDIGKASIYLFKELPLQSWKPSVEDINIISNWLCSDEFPLNSFTNQLARLLISNINWGKNKEGTELMVDMSMHQKIALSIMEAYGKFIRAPDGSYIVWAYEQLAWVANAVKSAVSTATATDEEGFVKWAWEMLFSLRLHCLDEVRPPYEDVLNGCVVRDEVLTIHHLGVNDVTVNSTACYVAILLTPCGRQADSISKDGCNLLLKLIENKQYVAAVNILPYIMPFFYKNPTGLSKNEKFNKCIQRLLTADIDDMTYLQKAKSMISSESLGKVLPIMASMIKLQVEQAKSMNASPDVVKLWLKVLFEILISAIKRGILETWKGSKQVYYLLDEISRIAFGDPVMRDAVFMEIKNIAKFLCIPAQESTSLLDTIVQFIPRRDKAFLLSDVVPVQYRWLSWYVINIELECSNGSKIWKQVLSELAVQPNISPSDALKKVVNSVKIKFPLNSLPIYKFSQLVMKTPVLHPLFPLFCQQFFIYYFYRVPNTHSLTGIGSLGRKFFENSSLKEMRALLESARDENYKISDTCEAKLSNSDKNKIPLDKQSILKDKKEFHEKLVKLFASFTLWLDDHRLHNPSITVYDLPSSYLPDRLSCIFSLDMEPWYTLVDYEALQDDVDKQLNAWYCYKKSSGVSSCSETHPTKESVEEKILQKLCSYGSPKPPPPIRRIKPSFESVQEEIFYSYDSLKGRIESDLLILRESVDEFSKQMLEIKELDKNYHKGVMELYKNIETKVSYKVSCSRGDEDSPGGCSGAAIIFMTIEEKEKDKKVSQEIENNRVSYHMLMASVCKPLRSSFYCAAAHVAVCLRTLLDMTDRAKKFHNSKKCKELCQLGISLFYDLMDSFDEKINNFQPTKSLLSEQLHFLFKEFVQENYQSVQLLQTLTAHKHVGSLLSVLDLFNPLAHNGSNFVELYESVVNLNKNADLPQNVMLTLVRKFNIAKWLPSNRTFSQRIMLIDSLGRALCCNRQPLNGKKDIYDVYEEHLGCLLCYGFPEHYSAILNMLLNGMETLCLPKEAWTKFLNSLGLTLPTELAVDHREVVEEYSRKQPYISHSMARDTLKRIANHFRENAEKLNLYEKYSYYVASVSNVLTVFSHVFINTLLCGLTMNENEMVGALLETLKETFGQWILPTEKKSPWSPNNVDQAAVMFRSFIVCLDYLEKRISEYNHGSTILPIVWRYYVDAYSPSFVKEHVRVAAQEHLSILKWNKFAPELKDLELMIQLVDGKVHSNVNFVSSIFVKIPWTNINCLSGNARDTSSSEVLPVLTNLIVKLAWEPAVVEAGTLPLILRSAEACNWYLVSEETLVQVVDTFIEKCNPRCVLQENQSGSTDDILLRFLRITTCMEPLELLQRYPNTLQHRLLYVKTFASLLIQCSVTQPTMLKEKNLFVKAVHNIMHQIEFSAQYNVALSNRFKQMVEMIGKLLSILSDAPQAEMRDIAIEGVLTWFEEKPSSVLLLPCIQATCRSVNCISYLVKIIECCISKHFLRSSEITYILKYLSIPESQEEDFLNACSKENSHLCQYIYVEQKLLESKHHENGHLLNMLVNCNEEANPSENSEQKLFLLWDKILALSLKQIEVTESEAVAREALEKFIKRLATFGKARSWFYLKAPPYKVSTRFRFLCRFVASFVAVQIPIGDPVRLVKYAEGHISYRGASSPTTKEKVFSDRKCKPYPLAEECIQQLQSLLKCREYSNIKDSIEKAVNSVMDADKHLGDIRNLLKTFISELYRNSPNKFLHWLNPEER